MSKRKPTKQVTMDMIYKAVASSTAIEVSDSAEVIEKRLRENRVKYRDYKLA